MKQIITINIGRLWNLKIRVAGTMPNYYTSYLTIYVIVGKNPRVNVGNQRNL